MHYAHGGGGGFLGNILKGVTGIFSGPETPDIPDDSETQEAERRAQEEASRRERARIASKSGRTSTLLTGGGSTAGVPSKKKTLLGSVK